MSDLGTSDPVVLQFQQTRLYTKREIMEFRAANPLLYDPNFYRTPFGSQDRFKSPREKK